MRGEAFPYPKAVAALIRTQLERTKDDAHAGDVLTPRELEIVKLVAEGTMTRPISYRPWGCGPRTDASLLRC